MDLGIQELLSVSPIYIAILGLLFVPMTVYVGLYRVKHQVDIGDGGDKELLRRIRGQANFIETVPIALVLLICVELMGASDGLLHSVGGLLVISRLLHYVGLTRMGPFLARPAGMVGTFSVYLITSIWILYALFF